MYEFCVKLSDIQFHKPEFVQQHFKSTSVKRLSSPEKAILSALQKLDLRHTLANEMKWAFLLYNAKITSWSQIWTEVASLWWEC